MKYTKILTIVALFAVSCTPYVNYQPLSVPEAAKSAEYNISVYHELDPLPPQSRTICKITINNAVQSIVNCGYKDVIKLAKWKARKVGGDALYITNIKLPN